MAKGDREILKADIDDGYTTIANLLLEALAMAKMTGVQKGICLFLVRRTYGWGQKEDAITLKEFAQACGTSPSYVSRQLKELIRWNVIKRVSYKPGRTPVYTFNTRVAQWDKGCTDVQGLNNGAIQGLYNRARVPFNNRARVVQGQTLDSTGSVGSPKERVKEKGKEKGLPPHTPPKPESIEDVLTEFPRYSNEQLTLIREYWEMIRFTRKTGNVAYSIVQREMQYWERFSVEIVLEALDIHMRRYQTKQEDYTRGIMRRLGREKMQKGMVNLGPTSPAKKDYSLRLEPEPKRDYTRGLPGF